MAKVKKKIRRKTEGIRMKFSVKDRVLMSNQLLPKEGDIVTLSIARDILEKVKLSQDEIKRSGLEVNEASRLRWKKDFKKVIEFSKAELELLKKQINDLDTRKKITPELLDLCLMIKG